MDVPQLTDDEMAEIKKDVSTSNRRLKSRFRSTAWREKVRVAENTDIFPAGLTDNWAFFCDLGRFIPPAFFMFTLTTGVNITVQLNSFFFKKNQNF